MLFTHQNARGARVYDVATKEEMRQVMSIDTEAGEVKCASQPISLNGAGDEVETYTVKFDTIHPIRGMEPMPVLFHCYGRRH